MTDGPWHTDPGLAWLTYLATPPGPAEAFSRAARVRRNAARAVLSVKAEVDLLARGNRSRAQLHPLALRMIRELAQDWVASLVGDGPRASHDALREAIRELGPSNRPDWKWKIVRDTLFDLLPMLRRGNPSGKARPADPDFIPARKRLWRALADRQPQGMSKEEIAAAVAQAVGVASETVEKALPTKAELREAKALAEQDVWGVEHEPHEHE